MRKRNNPVQIYLDDAELKRLHEWSAAAKMSRSNYIRQLIAGFQPVAFPPVEYRQVIDELQHIGINMNQLATKAHSLGFIDEPEYRVVDNLACLHLFPCKSILNQSAY